MLFTKKLLKSKTEKCILCEWVIAYLVLTNKFHCVNKINVWGDKIIFGPNWFVWLKVWHWTEEQINVLYTYYFICCLIHSNNKEGCLQLLKPCIIVKKQQPKKFSIHYSCLGSFTPALFCLDFSNCAFEVAAACSNSITDTSSGFLPIYHLFLFKLKYDLPVLKCQHTVL